MLDYIPELNAMLSRGTFPTDLKTLKLDKLHIYATHPSAKETFEGALRLIKLLSEKCRVLRVLHLPLQLSNVSLYEMIKEENVYGIRKARWTE